MTSSNRSEDKHLVTRPMSDAVAKNIECSRKRGMKYRVVEYTRCPSCGEEDCEGRFGIRRKS